MVLVDTSVWIDHLREGDEQLAALLNANQVLMHPFVLGEIALGHLKRREALLQTLARLPQARVATDDEVLLYIGNSQLFGKGIGYSDAQLLASLRITPGSSLWTRDKRLLAACPADLRYPTRLH